MSLPFMLSMGASRNAGSSSGRKNKGGKSKGAASMARVSIEVVRAQKRSNVHLDIISDPLHMGADDGILPQDGNDGSPYDGSNRLKVAVLGLAGLGSQIAFNIASKPGWLDVSVHSPCEDEVAPFHLMPGVSVAHTASEACLWADVIIICMPSYEASQNLLDTPGMVNSLQGRVIVQLTSGSPEDALLASEQVTAFGGSYLDGCLMGSEASALGKPGTCIMLSGEKASWLRVQPLVRMLAPKSFWCGERAEHPNAANLAGFVFLAACQMGLQQSEDIAKSYKLDPRIHSVVANGMLGVLPQVIAKETPPPVVSKVQELTACVDACMKQGIPHQLLIGMLEKAHQDEAQERQDSHKDVDASDDMLWSDTSKVALDMDTRNASPGGSHSSEWTNDMEEAMLQVELGLGCAMDPSNALA